MPPKPKICKELIDEILTYKENGLSDSDICDMCMIGKSTFYEWVSEGEKIKNGDLELDDVPYGSLKVDLAEGLKRAKVAFKAFHIQNITKAGKKNWQASAWMLERFFPKEFGRIDRQVAIMGEADKENGMLEEILDYLGMANGEKDERE